MFNSHGCVSWSLTIGSSNGSWPSLILLSLFIRTVVVDLSAFLRIISLFWNVRRSPAGSGVSASCILMYSK